MAKRVNQRMEARKHEKHSHNNNIVFPTDIMAIICSHIEIDDISTILSILLVERKAIEYIKEHCLRLFLIVAKTIDNEDWTKVNKPKFVLHKLGSTSTLPYILNTILYNHTTYWNRENVIFLLTVIIDIMASASLLAKKILEYTWAADTVYSDESTTSFLLRNHHHIPVAATTQLCDLYWIDKSNHQIRPFSEFTGEISAYDQPLNRNIELRTRPAKYDDNASQILINGEHLFSDTNKSLREGLYVDSRGEEEKNVLLNSGEFQREWRKHVIGYNIIYSKVLLRLFKADSVVHIITCPTSPQRIIDRFTKICSSSSSEDDEVGIEEQYDYTSSSLDNTDSIIEITISDEYSDDEEEDEISTEEEDDDEDEDDEEDDDEEDWSSDESSSFSLSTPSTTDDDDDEDDDDDDVDTEDEEISTTY